ncbi:MAG: hypothetical protein GOMPHAMPRED_001814 [Gomphillus americanus]|uniref:Uncharacterized protein n=1 Tax=Gomphillus americanus TaxID=1940652 RepID=A0A8H3F823_9LECA|nr:MAG: hypothetical protein GOMPHAMPRED_001814 [Gomphillus americanus]
MEGITIPEAGLNSPSYNTPVSYNDSYFSTNTVNTQATTPGEITLGGFHTIIVTPKNLGSIAALERAFIEFEPFKKFCCAFCADDGVTCKCQALPTTTHSRPPGSKKKLLRYLAQEQAEADHIQAATLAYLLVLEKHVPFGLAFNLDQQAKCGRMNGQLEHVKYRIADVRRALELLDDDLCAVPTGILEACTLFRPVLANCLGNARENHICFKLNFKLFTK